MTARLARSLGVAGPGEPRLFEVPQRDVEEGGFVVDTVYSGVSAGTESALLLGSHPLARSRWNPAVGLFEEAAAVDLYPVRSLGYMEVAVVTETRTDAVAVGQLVAMSYGHLDRYTATTDDFVLALPPDIDPLLGVFVSALGPSCANGLLHAAAAEAGAGAAFGSGVRGKRVAVIGGGSVGQLTALFASAEGAAAVALVDGAPSRLAAAEALGSLPVDSGAVDPGVFLKDLWRDGHGAGADIVFQCRGNSAALRDALRCLRPQGLVVDLAFYQDPASAVRLGEEFHHTALTIRCAQLGHIPRVFAGRWSRHDLAERTVQLVRDRGEEIRAHLIARTVPFDQGAGVLTRLAQRHEPPLTSVLTFDHAGTG